MADLQNGFNWARWIDPLLEAKCVNRRRGLEGVAAKSEMLALIVISWNSLLEGLWRIKTLHFPLG
jgi:hypothetical protein